MRSRPRVAMVSFEFPEICVAIANALSRTADVSLMLPRHLVAGRDDIDPALRVDAFVKPRLRQPVRQLRTCGAIVRALRRFAPDVVHVQSGHLWFNLALPAIRDLPLVVTVHDVVPHPGDRETARTPRAALTFGYRRATELIVHAESLKAEAAERLGVDRRRIHVVPHVAIGPTKQGSWAQGDGRTVLFFGRIWPYKGLEHLLRAQPLINERIPDARFVIAGEGEDFGRYRAMMHDASRFEVINEYVSARRRAELFAQAAVVVLPYIEASQSGVVPLASAFEKPVVASAVGGLPEAVEHDRTGLLVPPGDHRAIADAVVRLLAAPVFARDLGIAARRKLEQECSGDAVAGRTLRVYEAAARDHPNGSAESIAAT
jgi:glycosyltransferase involved in cell wall biosynthesis